MVNAHSNNVSVIDGATNKVIANISVGLWQPGYIGVAYDSANGYIYVTNWDSGSVSIISTSFTTTNNYLIYIIIALVMITVTIGVAVAMRRKKK